MPRLEPWEHTTSAAHPPPLRQNSTFSFSSVPLPFLLSSHIGPAVSVSLLSANSSSPVVPLASTHPRPSVPIPLPSLQWLVPFFIPPLLLTRSCASCTLFLCERHVHTYTCLRTRVYMRVTYTRACTYTWHPLFIPCLSFFLSLSICLSVLSIPL